MVKSIVTLFILLALTVSLISCSPEQDFTCAELTITVPDGYTERDRPEGANMLLSDGTSTVTVRRISFADAYKEGVPSGYSDGEFAKFFLEKSGIDGTLASYRTIPYYTYYTTGDGVKLFCLSSFFRTPYAYFIIVFATRAELEKTGRSVFFAALESVRVEIVEGG